jgi:hypothetical protein
LLWLVSCLSSLEACGDVDAGELPARSGIAATGSSDGADGADMAVSTGLVLYAIGCEDEDEAMH